MHFPNASSVLIAFAVVFPPLVRAIPVDISKVSPDAVVRMTQPSAGEIVVEWPANRDGMVGGVVFALDEGSPLIKSVTLSGKGAGDSPNTIAHGLEPYFELTVAERDLKRNGWMVFFDRVHLRARARHALKGTPSSARAESSAGRGSVTFEGLSTGEFHGRLVFTFYAGSPFLHVAAVLRTQEPAQAILYDAGLRAAERGIARFAWTEPGGRFVTRDAGGVAGMPYATKYRTMIAQFETGSLAIFPPPHRYIYPLDFSDNFGFNFAGNNYDADAPGFSFGVRQPPEGDHRYVPWVNAPPGTWQRLDFFVLLSAGQPVEALESVKRYTRGDRYEPLPGFKTFTSHYHIEHTLDVLQEKKLSPGAAELPERLRSPGFVKAFRETGVDIVHLAEFHHGVTPQLDAAGRLEQLQLLHAECARLSDDEFLLLPGEEPNVHLGGHWISFFPKPVYWVLNRPENTPFVQNTPEGQTVYHVGSAEDILELMEREHGLMWTAHARVKSSIGYPDAYRDTAFYKSDRFLGAAWKAMPADYSRDTLGWRALDLQDDSANWGERKFTLGEVDVFRVEPEHELYGAMNINYVELDAQPRYEDGWQPLVDALRGGRFFVSTGEILISRSTVNGARSGETAQTAADQPLVVTANLRWTFPLSFAVLVWGDGSATTRHRIDLSGFGEFGITRLTKTVPSRGAKWARLEIWDIAGNGAFTQPVWLRQEGSQ